MARLVVSINDTTIINMVRAAGGPGVAGVEDQAIVNILNNYAYPRIRNALVSAKSANTRDEGINVFLGANRTLADLSNAAVQTEIDDKITAIISGTMMQEQIEQISTTMGAGRLLVSEVGIVQQFNRIGLDLIKQADADLDKLVNGPLFAQAVAALVDSKTDSAIAVNIYLAHEIDPATYSATTGSANTFSSAQENGVARLWIGKDMIQASVTLGDTYVDVMYNLLAAYRTEQNNRETVGDPLLNVAIGPDEGKIAPVVGRILQTDVVGNVTSKSAQVVAGMGWLALHALNYDGALDANMVTLELGKDLGGGLFDLGIAGLVYGTEGSYSALTSQGPHSVLIDIKTGKTATTASSTKTDTKKQLDTLYFAVDPIPSTASFDFGVGTLDSGETLTITVNARNYVYTAATNGDNTYPLAIMDDINKFSIQYFGVPLKASVTGTVFTLAWSEAVSEGQAFAVTTTGVAMALTNISATFTGFYATTELRTAGQFRYRTTPLKAAVGLTGTPIRTVAVPINTDVMVALQLLVDDMYDQQENLKVVAAMRSPVLYTLGGTPVSAPSIQFVAYVMDDANSRVVFDLIEVPVELLSAPKPKDSSTLPNFDAKSKSLVLEPVTLRRNSTTEDTSLTNQQMMTHYIAPAETALQKKFKEFDKYSGRFLGGL